MSKSCRWPAVAGRQTRQIRRGTEDGVPKGKGGG